MSTTYSGNPFTVSETYIDLSQNTQLTSDITITTNNYFVFGQDGITFDGQGHTITIESTTNGLFRNGTGSNAYSNITIKNVRINVSPDSFFLSGNNGWLCQQYFGNNNDDNTNTNNIIENCSSNGNINSGWSGGIVGRYSKDVRVIGCFYSGIISGSNCGGIIGPNSENPFAENCYVVVK